MASANLEQQQLGMHRKVPPCEVRRLYVCLIVPAACHYRRLCAEWTQHNGNVLQAKGFSSGRFCIMASLVTEQKEAYCSVDGWAFELGGSLKRVSVRWQMSDPDH